MYKMIAFDIDGTLIQHSTHEIPAEIDLMFKKLKEKKYIITLATGRDFVSIGNLYKNEYIDYFIGANGSFIFDVKNNKYIENSVIKFSEFEKINEQIFQNNLNEIQTIILSDNKNVYVYESFQKSHSSFWEYFKDKFKKYNEAKRMLKRDHFHLITIEHQVGSKILDKIKKYLLLNKNSSIDIQAYWPKGLFIANKKTNKSQALKKLCKYLKIEMANVIAFGDSENDIEMINDAGLGVAMGNSIEELKKISDAVTTDVEKFGTKFFLEKLGII